MYLDKHVFSLNPSQLSDMNPASAVQGISTEPRLSRKA